MPLAGTQPLGTADLSDGSLSVDIYVDSCRWQTVQFSPHRRSPAEHGHLPARTQAVASVLIHCIGNVFWVLGRAAGLSLDGSLTLPVLMWESTTTVVLHESLSDMPGLILTVLSPRRTFGIKLKITLSAMQDDEGRWMAGPWLPH